MAGASCLQGHRSGHEAGPTLQPAILAIPTLDVVRSGAGNSRLWSCWAAGTPAQGLQGICQPHWYFSPPISLWVDRRTNRAALGLQNLCTDLPERLPGYSCMAALSASRANAPGLSVILMTAKGQG